MLATGDKISMHSKFARIILLCFIIFSSSQIYSEKHSHPMLSGPDPYHIPSIAENFQNNVRIEVRHNDPWDSLDFSPRDPNEPTAFEDFKDAWKNIGKGIGGGFVYLGKGIMRTPSVILDGLERGLDKFDDWLDRDEINNAILEQQARIKKYKENLSKQAHQLNDSPYQKIQKIYEERIEIISNEDSIRIRYEKTYTISPELSPYLEKHSLKKEDFEFFNGNKVQHQLHQEVLDILISNYEINRIFSKYQQKTLFTDLVTEGADLARELNVHGDVVKGFQIADYCRWLNEAEYPLLAHVLKQTGAVVVGTAEGCLNIGLNTYNIFRHPVETWNGLVFMGDQLGKFLFHGMVELSLVGQHVSFDGAPCDIAYFPLIKQDREDTYTKYELQNPDFINDLKVLEAYYNHTSQEFAKLPPEEQTRKIVALAFELYFSGKFLRQVGKVKSAAFKHVIKPAFNRIATQVELFSYKAIGETCTRIAELCETVESYIYQKADGAEYYYDWVIDESGAWKEVITVKPIPALNNPLVNYKEFTPLPKPRTTPIPATTSFSDVQRNIAKNVLSERAEALQFAKNSMAQKVPELVTKSVQNTLAITHNIPGYLTLAEEIDELRSLFDQTRMGWGKMRNKYLKIKYKHILDADPNDKLSGLHHDYLGYYEQNNILQVDEKMFGQFDQYGGKPRWNNGGGDYKTFFPQYWTRRKVIENILEAYDNFVSSGIEPILSSNGKYNIIGETNSGLKIRMFIDQNCNLLSAYPII